MAQTRVREITWLRLGSGLSKYYLVREIMAQTRVRTRIGSRARVKARVGLGL